MRLPSSASSRFLLLAAPPCLALGGVAAAGLGWGWTGGLALGGLAGGAVYAAARWSILRPVAALDEALEPIRKGSVVARVPGQQTPELERIARVINDLLARLTDRDAAALDQARGAATPEPPRPAPAVGPALLAEEANRRLAVRLRELSLLFDITRSLNSTLELDGLLHRLTRQVATTLGFDGFAVLLVDEAHGALHVRAAHGVLPPAEHQGERLPLGAGPGGEALATGDLVLRRSTPVGDGEGSVLAVPMQHKDQVVGVLEFTRRRVDAFAPDEIKLLTSIAGQAALAIANARLYEQTVALSITDPLTGVFNRRHLFAHLAMELQRAERYGDPLTVAMVDIDRFKLLNDTFGHAVGDEVLRQVAHRLRRSLRRSDMLARFGGEEFCVVLPRLTGAGALEVAEKLRLAVANEPIDVGEGRALAIAVSVGVASHPEGIRDSSALLAAADAALYLSKRGGRNRSTAFEAGMELHPQGSLVEADGHDPDADPAKATGATGSGPAR